MNNLKVMTIAILASLVSACCTHKQTEQQPSELVPAPTETPLTGVKPNALPKAVIYKTNGDYINNVPVNLNADRTKIISYPAPTDVTVESAGLPICNGWLLDRRGGVGENTAFLKYTYEEYSKLSAPLSMQEMMQSIIPEARVVAVKVLPITQSEALSDSSLLKQYAE